MKTLNDLTGRVRTKDEYNERAWPPAVTAAAIALPLALVWMSLFFLYLSGALLYLGIAWDYRNSDRRARVAVRLPSDDPVPGLMRTREGALCVLGSFLILEFLFWVLP